MNLSNAMPPNIDMIDSVFGVKKLLTKGHNIFFCYGDTLFCPNGAVHANDPIIKAHEPVHSKQQGIDPDGWWERYCNDKEFRLEQEIPAHQQELIFISNLEGMDKPIPGFRSRFEYHKLKIAQRLSSPLYGSVISTSKAKRLLCDLS